MRRLVVSDLHFGLPGALLADSRYLSALEPELEWADELVILGDLLALEYARWDACVEASRGFVDAIAAADVRLVHIVFGNQDEHLGAMRADAVGISSALGRSIPDPAEALLGEIFAPTPVRFHGEWTSLDGVTLIHGHQAMRLLPVSEDAARDRARWSRPRRPVSLAEAAMHEAPLAAGRYRIGQAGAGDERLRLLRGLFKSITGGGDDRLVDVVGEWAARGGVAVLRLREGDALLSAVSEVLDATGSDDRLAVVGHTHQAHEGIGTGRWTVWNAGSWVKDEWLERGDPTSRPGTVVRWDGDLSLRRLVDEPPRG